MIFISLFFREVKIEKEIFPSGTDSRFLREVTLSISYSSYRRLQQGMAFYFPPLSGVVAETTAGTIRQFCVQWLLVNGNSSCCERICYVTVMLCSQIIRIMEAINVCRVKIYFAVNAETYNTSAQMRNISNRPLLLLCLQCTEGHLLYKTDTLCWSLPFFSHFTVTKLSLRRTPL